MPVTRSTTWWSRCPAGPMPRWKSQPKRKWIQSNKTSRRAPFAMWRMFTRNGATHGTMAASRKLGRTQSTLTRTPRRWVRILAFFIVMYILKGRWWRSNWRVWDWRPCPSPWRGHRGQGLGYPCDDRRGWDWLEGDLHRCQGWDGR